MIIDDGLICGFLSGLIGRGVGEQSPGLGADCFEWIKFGFEITGSGSRGGGASRCGENEPGENHPPCIRPEASADADAQIDSAGIRRLPL